MVDKELSLPILFVKSVHVGSFFWSVFSGIWTEYGKIRTRKNSVFGHFSRYDSLYVIDYITFINIMKNKSSMTWSQPKSAFQFFSLVDDFQPIFINCSHEKRIWPFSNRWWNRGGLFQKSLESMPTYKKHQGIWWGYIYPRCSIDFSFTSCLKKIHGSPKPGISSKNLAQAVNWKALQ